MQNHRVHGDELLALEPVDEETGRGGIVELGKPLIDEVEALHGAAIVVVVMADDQPLRHTLDAGRITRQRFLAVRHQRRPGAGSATIAMRSNHATAQCRLGAATMRSGSGTGRMWGLACTDAGTRAATPRRTEANPEIVRIVPSMRNRLGNASAAQSLDGHRLTGSLRIPRSCWSIIPSPYPEQVGSEASVWPTGSRYRVGSAVLSVHDHDLRLVLGGPAVATPAFGAIAQYHQGIAGRDDATPKGAARDAARMEDRKIASMAATEGTAAAAWRLDESPHLLRDSPCLRPLPVPSWSMIRSR